MTCYSHENTGEIELDLETNIDVGTIDGRTPPKREATIGNLVETGALCVSQLFISHRLLETRGLLPEQTCAADQKRGPVFERNTYPPKLGSMFP